MCLFLSRLFLSMRVYFLLIINSLSVFTFVLIIILLWQKRLFSFIIIIIYYYHSNSISISIPHLQKNNHNNETNLHISNSISILLSFSSFRYMTFSIIDKYSNIRLLFCDLLIVIQFAAHVFAENKCCIHLFLKC